MRTTFSIVRTDMVEVTDTVVCDGCDKVLDMNLHIKDRNTKYPPDKHVVTGKYFRLVKYLPDSDYDDKYFCPDCMKKHIDALSTSDAPFVDGGIETHRGTIIPEAIEAERADAEAEMERKKAEQKARYDTEVIATIERSVAEEEARYNRMFGDGQ